MNGSQLLREFENFVVREELELELELDQHVPAICFTFWMQLDRFCISKRAILRPSRPKFRLKSARVAENCLRNGNRNRRPRW